MPRFFFDVVDGGVEPDREGMDLPNLGEARVTAVHFGAAWLRANPDVVWHGKEWRIEVSDGLGLLYLTLVILAIDAPAARPPVDRGERLWTSARPGLDEVTL